MKGYHRKAVVFEMNHKYKETFEVYKEAVRNCESSVFLTTQLKLAETNYAKVFKTIEVTSDEDFVERFNIMTDVRERLSTLVHFWNGIHR